MNEKRSPPLVALIGAPTDVGAGVAGAWAGPWALRSAGIEQALIGAGCDVLDMGDCNGPANPQSDSVEGCRNLPEVAVWCAAVKSACESAMRAGRIPILLGGDHVLAIGSVAAAAEQSAKAGRKVRVIWLDAHADFNTAATSPSGNMHGMPLAVLCQSAPDLIKEVARPGTLSVADLRLVGIRSVDEGEAHALGQLGVWVLGVKALKERGAKAAARDLLAGLHEDDHVHISFDVDFLDPEDAPGVGTGVEGGPTRSEARALFEAIGALHRVSSVDIVELNPSLDERGKTAQIAVELVVSLFTAQEGSE